jgi:hypothetical protein
MATILVWSTASEERRVSQKAGRREEKQGRRRTLLVVSVDLDGLVAVLAEVELDVVLVLLEAVKEEDGLAVVC